MHGHLVSKASLTARRRECTSAQPRSAPLQGASRALRQLEAPTAPSPEHGLGSATRTGGLAVPPTRSRSPPLRPAPGTRPGPSAPSQPGPEVLTGEPRNATGGRDQAPGGELDLRLHQPPGQLPNGLPDTSSLSPAAPARAPGAPTRGPGHQTSPRQNRGPAAPGRQIYQGT